MCWDTLNMFDKCFCSSCLLCSFCVRLTIAVIAILFGSTIASRPKEAINMQIALYRLFNWKLEPISWKKGIRNIRVMGLALLILGMASLLYTFLGK